MTNSLKLKAKIVEHGYNQKSFAKIVNIGTTKFSHALNNKASFSTRDIEAISKELKLSREEIFEIFFSRLT